MAPRTQSPESLEKRGGAERENKQKKLSRLAIYMEINNPTLMLFLIFPDRLAFSLGERGWGHSSPSSSHTVAGEVLLSQIPKQPTLPPRSTPRPPFLRVVPNAAFRLEKETLGGRVLKVFRYCTG